MRSIYSGIGALCDEIGGIGVAYVTFTHKQCRNRYAQRGTNNYRMHTGGANDRHARCTDRRVPAHEQLLLDYPPRRRVCVPDELGGQLRNVGLECARRKRKRSADSRTGVHGRGDDSADEIMRSALRAVAPFLRQHADAQLACKRHTAVCHHTIRLQ